MKTTVCNKIVHFCKSDI